METPVIDKKPKRSKEEKKERRERKEKKADKDRSSKKAHRDKPATGSAFNLLADEKSVDATLSSLFAVKQPPVKSKTPIAAPPTTRTARVAEDDAAGDDNDAELSELDEDMDDEDDASEDDAHVDAVSHAVVEISEPKRKRKRKDAEEQLEDAYMSRLAREEEKDAQRLAAERAAKRAKRSAEQSDAQDGAKEVDGGDAGEAVDDQDSAPDDQYETASDDESATSPPPKHETEEAHDVELDKANRTVFLGNVSTTAISSKSARKVLLNHLASFFPKLSADKAGFKAKVESIRFRSTPYASAIPRKAAYAKKELMDATAKSTNVYVVYSTPYLAREACQHLNGTVVLDRHLRVDAIAHPAKVDNRRCVFVGNLGFVDDESNIQEANEQDGREKRKRGKEPADVEEGLWRTFGKCGKVEGVRVIRDSTTRVGKGIAYVQFEDENAVEAALLLNEKKFPPMLPRKLRVSRAKAPKKNAKAGSGRPSLKPQQRGSGYQRKITGEEASRLGRSAKLLGRAAAANMRKGDEKSPKEASSQSTTSAAGIRKPENFVFEGHRATARSGKSGLKLGGAKGAKSKSKITKRSSSFKKKKA
ncbi:Putative RNA recognition motif domain, nucleotide-binding alpha-beta plait domain superfamily [Septoria linicola]|uniref:Nucleolar protein 12 n=1 Tax=Septoria linicola TaxID=215465 RepID=A0A9Q9EDU7_9PEZI|nr:Putative RNA recognition motif domain, nucleotide-binding alpha-beta plait domain superfamily [Septoria linicola]